MSIVLEALRRAEAERGRGEVPGLHSAVTPTAVPLPASPTSSLPWQGVAIGAGGLLALVALVIGAGAWWRWVQADVPTPVAAQTPSQPAAPVPPAVAVAPVSPVAPVAPAAPIAQAAPVAPVAPAPTLLRVPPAALPAARTAPVLPAVKAAPPVVAVAASASATSTTTAPAEPAATPAAPPADGKAVALADLPDEIRRDLPPLNVGGLIQMDDPPRRSLIINGAIVMEGEAVQPGLLLERIGSGQATLRFKGWRFLLGI